MNSWRSSQAIHWAMRGRGYSIKIAGANAYGILTVAVLLIILIVYYSALDPGLFLPVVVPGPQLCMGNHHVPGQTLDAPSHPKLRKR